MAIRILRISLQSIVLLVFSGCSALRPGLNGSVSSDVARSGESVGKKITSRTKGPVDLHTPGFPYVARIEVGVKTCQVRAFGTDATGNESRSAYVAATATQKKSKGLPYGKEGEIWQIVLNPSWNPPESIRAEYAAKGKFLSKVVPPGPNNPLGKIKLFIRYDGNNSALGIHNTNQEHLIRGNGRNRLSHGCTRMKWADISVVAGSILRRNGYDPAALFASAGRNPGKSIFLPLKVFRPKVVYLEN